MLRTRPSGLHRMMSLISRRSVPPPSMMVASACIWTRFACYMQSQCKQRAGISSTAFISASAPTPSSPSSSAAPSPSSDEETALSAYRGQLSYPFGLPGAEYTIEAYRTASSVETATSHLDSLSASLSTERHALDLDSALQKKGVFKGASAAGAAKAQQQPNSSSGFKEIASRVDLLHADITNIETEGILLEKYQKTFVLYRPDDTTSTSPSTPSSLPTADGLRFVCSWFTQQHPARRELAAYSFHASIRITPFDVESEIGEMRDVGNVLRLFDVSECDSTRNDVQLFQAIYQSYAGKDVTEKEFAWFISFLASHPSDRAVSPLTIDNSL